MQFYNNFALIFLSENYFLIVQILHIYLDHVCQGEEFWSIFSDGMEKVPNIFFYSSMKVIHRHYPNDPSYSLSVGDHPEHQHSCHTSSTRPFWLSLFQRKEPTRSIQWAVYLADNLIIWHNFSHFAKSDGHIQVTSSLTFC